MERRSHSRCTRNTPQPFGVLWIAGAMIFLLLCGGLLASGGSRLARAQGQSPTNTIPTPYQCMHIVYSRVTETSVVVGVRNNTGASTRLQSASVDWPSELATSGDYMDYFMFYTGTFNTTNDYTPPTSSAAPGTGTAYDIANTVTREFVAAFGPLPLPVALSGSFSVTLTFTNGCSVSVTIDKPEPPTPTFYATNTIATPGVCMSVQYAYVTELSVVVGVRNNTASGTRLQTAALDWPSSLGGAGGIYVDYFQFAGNQFYGGNDTSPPTSYTRASSALFQIDAGQSRNFAAVFGLAPLIRPLYGTFTVTLTFFNGCSVSATVTRTPPPSSCPMITNAYISGSNLVFTVYNGTGADTTFIGASLDWPDIPSPARYMNYFTWGANQFWGVNPPANDNSPPSVHNAPSPISFTAGQTTAFTATFGSAGVLVGSFSVTLYFGVPCSADYVLWWGMTPTFTPTSTPTYTPTSTDTPTPSNTFTPIPLQGSISVSHASLLLNAPDFKLPAQTISGNVLGGDAPYVVTVYIKAPSQEDDEAVTYSVNLESAGSFVFSPATTGDVYLGCSEEGVWQAWIVVADSSGGAPATSNRISWTVNFPQVHGIP